jgi:hypothetical protein
MNKEELRKVIGEAIGAASMCWSETPTGVFKSDRADEILGEVMNAIDSTYGVERPKEETFLERLINEEKELGEKIVLLNKGLQSDGFAGKVGNYQFELLFLQHTIMGAYRQVLIMRINDLNMANALKDALTEQKA